MGGPKLRDCFDMIDQNMELHSNIGVEEAYHSVSSSDYEETNDRATNNKHDLNQILDDIDDANQLEQLRDGLSDLDTFSGRNTPVTSDNDTPSSHSHEDLNGLLGKCLCLSGLWTQFSLLTKPSSSKFDIIINYYYSSNQQVQMQTRPQAA